MRIPVPVPVPASSIADLRNRLLGTWRMITWTRRLVASAEDSDVLGPNPFGYINYAPDGRVMVFVLRSGRPRPSASPPSPSDKIALFDNMFAYVGSYEVKPDRVVHTLDGSWNELWTGTQQTRFVSLEGDQLIYTTPETMDPMNGQPCTYRVSFERVKAQE